MVGIEIRYPSGDPGFVEYRRSFAVEGGFSLSGELPQDASLCVRLLDAAGRELRRVGSSRPRAAALLYHPALTAYPEEMDPGRARLADFGFPPLVVEDPARPEESLRRGSIKCFFSQEGFKAIVISASDRAHGAAADDGMGFLQDDGSPYELLPEADYRICVTLSRGGEILGSAEKAIRIGRRKDQIICRFNPTAHKERMLRWCGERGLAIISDPLPGYLDPYLGVWLYHMGLLPMYRANDLALFETARVHMFVYLTDEHSTSYETELGYLQSRGAVGDPARFTAYHYDIGEAAVGAGTPRERAGRILEFPPGEYAAFCRADLCAPGAEEGRFSVEESGVLESFTDLDALTLPAGADVAFMGVLKPWQMDPADFRLLPENVYEMGNAPALLRYTLTDGAETILFERRPGLERLEGGRSLGGSVFEFYNIIRLREDWAGRSFRLRLQCFDRKGQESPAAAELRFRVTAPEGPESLCQKPFKGV